MFGFAILIGIYSQSIFLFGILGLLYKQNVILISIVYLFTAIFFTRKHFYLFRSKIENFLKKPSKLELIFLSLILLQAGVNLIGALGPELGFDALWYHLTLPKIYLISNGIDYISGGLLYYSAMPKFTEMLYVAGLSFGNEIYAKLIHFSFGILSLFALYKLSLKFLSKSFSLLVIVLFYSNLVVGWMSITSYVDLARTFFETMALLGFINWREKKDRKWLILSAIMLGLAISTKLLAIGSLLIFSILIIYSYWSSKFKWKGLFTNILVYWWLTLLIPLPWLLFSHINTGNPVYPFFTDVYPVNLNNDLISPIKFIGDVWNIFRRSADPISPIYIILLSVVIFLYKKFPDKLKIVYIYSLAAILVWYITPRTGGGRFILTYLPALSILAVYVINLMRNIYLRKIFIILIVFVSLFSIIYRFGANLKYIPVIFGIQSKSDFLSRNLNFSFGDFYDTDGYFKRNIKEGDKVLLYGFHNLYYVNFPFIDSSWVKKGDEFNYVAVQNSRLPEKFLHWNQIYYNPITKVKLYSFGEK